MFRTMPAETRLYKIWFVILCGTFQVIWALMVIIGFTAATLQLSLLVRKYLQFQVVELSEIKDSMPVEFPSVTVCNIEPISWRKLRLLFENGEDTELMQWLNFTMR